MTNDAEVTPPRPFSDFRNGQRAYEVILARLAARSDNYYQWPRWAAAEEAVQALAEAGLLRDD